MGTAPRKPPQEMKILSRAENLEKAIRINTTTGRATRIMKNEMTIPMPITGTISEG